MKGGVRRWCETLHDWHNSTSHNKPHWRVVWGWRETLHVDANRIEMAAWMGTCCCKTHCNGCMTATCGLFQGGSRSTKPCVFPCKVAPGGDWLGTSLLNPLRKVSQNLHPTTQRLAWLYSEQKRGKLKEKPAPGLNGWQRAWASWRIWSKFGMTIPKRNEKNSKSTNSGRMMHDLSTKNWVKSQIQRVPIDLP